jgi:hypothetical protein
MTSSTGISVDTDQYGLSGAHVRKLRLLVIAGDTRISQLQCHLEIAIVDRTHDQRDKARCTGSPAVGAICFLR